MTIIKPLIALIIFSVMGYVSFNYNDHFVSEECKVAFKAMDQCDQKTDLQVKELCRQQLSQEAAQCNGFVIMLGSYLIIGLSVFGSLFSIYLIFKNSAVYVFNKVRGQK